MTKAVMYWNRLRLEVNGHAGYAEEGKDIVCSAISMLTDALGGVLEEAEARGRCEYRIRDGDGSVVITADPTLGSVNEIKAYFRMVVTGFRMLQEQYPKHIQIQEVQ